LLAALGCRQTDYVPCCFSAFQILRRRCADQREYVSRQIEMGLDAIVSVPAPPIRHHPDVTTREWREDDPHEPYPLLHKVYDTPAGQLHTSVSQSEDWPWGDHVPFMDDFLIPRSREFLVTPQDDLAVLPYLLALPSAEDVKALRGAARAARDVASENDLLVAGYYGMAADAACWLCGMQELMMATVDEPDFVRQVLAIVEDWNRRRVELLLEQGLDLFIRRGWYEHADQWPPSQYREFILPGLHREVELTHQAGARYGYLMSCSSMPLIGMMMDAGVDVLIGVDPAQDRTMDLHALKARTSGKMALWGGVCGYLTMECGTAQDVSSQVRDSIAILAPGGGFILAPVTNVREDNPHVWRNVEAMIKAWRSLREYPVGAAGS
jgi:hypothetical protein